MKKIIILIVVIGFGILGWYLISPLFIDEVVDEEFPINQILEPLPEIVMVGMPESEIEGMMEGMSQEEREFKEKEIMELYSQKPDIVMEEKMSETNEPLKISTGNFEDADDFHQGSGSATVYKLSDDSHLLRLEDFSVTNGPDLRVYLTERAKPTKEDVKNGLELEKLKGNKGNQNYVLPDNLDPNDYGAVVIYCKPFSVIFSIATLEN